MYNIEQTNKFKKDIKLAKKRGLKMTLLDDVISILSQNGKLPSKYKPHLLVGNFKGFWECHIQPDWLLVWKQDEAIKLITLTRTGTHADLF